MGPIVVDNLLSKKTINEVQEYFEKQVKWSFCYYATGPGDEEFYNENAIETPQFVHVAYHSFLDEKNQQSIDYISNIFDNVIEKFNFQVIDINRLKINCTLKRTDFEGKHHPAHKDMIGPGWVSCIYYINDSDGPTVFFSETGELVQEVQPKKGRFVLFDSTLNHAGTCPTQNDYRLVSNLVFRPNNRDFLHERNLG